MSSKRLNEEEKKIYEEEFSEFLIEKLKFLGGSSKIHQLSACLIHARFKLRDAFGTTNSDLMKFLKAHPKLFLVDSKGTIYISVSGDDSDDLDNNKTTDSTKSSLSKIENGSGIIVKLHAEFGIIRAAHPIETYVHFTSQAFSGNTHTLLMDSRLEIGEKMCFNAYRGHEMFDFKYRASKVWRMLDGNVSPDESYKENVVSDHLEGEGVIHKLFSNRGFILVYGKNNETVFFRRDSVTDCSNMELTQFLHVGDRVEFSAIRSDEDSRTQWLARVVRKKARKDDGIPSSSHTKAKVSVAAVATVATVKNGAVKNRLEDEPGKISPYTRGAIIKFGRNYSEKASGDSSKYFLYGAEVSDIQFEFSEGDDVCFNAIKIKSPPGWRAILVWVGEKPSWININKLFADEELKESAEDESRASSSNISSASHSPSLRNKRTKPQSDAPFTTERVIQNRNKPFDHSVTKKGTQSDRDYKKRDSKSTKDLRSFSDTSERVIQNRNKPFDHSVTTRGTQPDRDYKKRDSKSTKDPRSFPDTSERVIQNRNKPFDHSVTKKGTQSDRDYKKRDLKSSKDPQSFSDTKSKSKKWWQEPPDKNSSKNKSKGNQYRTASGSDRGLDKISNPSDENYTDNLSCKDAISVISNDSFRNAKSQGISQKKRNGEQKRYGNLARASNYVFTSSDESNSDSAYNEAKYHKSADNRKPSIKKFEGIDGKIINLYCKAAIIRSSHLQKEVNFLLNALYLNGKPAEEQEVNDLKEIFKVGDNVKFNCFEIIDDSGEIYQKVTTAWKGSKPKVYEMTPKEFINEHDLSVTMSDESVSECVPQDKTKSVAKGRFRGFARASSCDLSDENDSDNASNGIKRNETADSIKPSVKKFDDVEGKIVNLYCKAAIIKSPRLQREIDFLINAFYLNGKSAEEEQVIDLKDIFKVGDSVKFNCFEIIDDSGEIYRKVTLAWKGRKPKVYEITPEDFINEHDLTVTMS